MEELISRKAVLDKLQQEHDFYINAYGNRCGFRDLAPKDEKARVDEIGIIRSIIMELPTIPQTDIPQEMLEKAIKCSKSVLDKMSEMSKEELLEIARHCGDSVLEDIKAELEKREDIPYDVEMYDYIQGLEYAISVIDKHISRKE